MEFYDKFVERFQDISKVKNPAVSKAEVKKLLRAFKRKCFYLDLSKVINVLGNNDAVTLTMLYLKVFHDMVSQNS